MAINKPTRRGFLISSLAAAAAIALDPFNRESYGQQPDSKVVEAYYADHVPELQALPLNTDYPNIGLFQPNLEPGFEDFLFALKKPRIDSMDPRRLANLVKYWMSLNAKDRDTIFTILDDPKKYVHALSEDRRNEFFRDYNDPRVLTAEEVARWNNTYNNGDHKPIFLWHINWRNPSDRVLAFLYNYVTREQQEQSDMKTMERIRANERRLRSNQQIPSGLDMKIF